MITVFRREPPPLLSEEEWEACAHPYTMLATVRRTLFCSERKLRLFLVACCRLGWYFLPEPTDRMAVEVAERFADGLATPEELQAARDHVTRAVSRSALAPSRGLWRTVESSSHHAYFETMSRFGAQGADSNQASLAVAKEYQLQAALVRELFGPLPFRRVAIDPAWLAWNDGEVVSLAEAIYSERAFERMPILADALEDAGCTNTEVIDHLRSRGSHVRGCWVLDLILGKE